MGKKHEKDESSAQFGGGGRRAGRGGRRSLEKRILKTVRFFEAVRDGRAIIQKVRPGDGIHSLRFRIPRDSDFSLSN